MKPMTTEQMATYLENCVAVCPSHGQQAITAIARRLRLLAEVASCERACFDPETGRQVGGGGDCRDLSAARAALESDEREGGHNG
jgi:hypothetical protein